jgi:hypothetical protein
MLQRSLRLPFLPLRQPPLNKDKERVHHLAALWPCLTRHLYITKKERPNP